MAAKQLPPVEILCQLFRYNSETGILIRSSTKNIAGYKEGKGYISVDVGSGNRFKAHRIIWVMFYGTDPVDQLDHVNGIKSDNRIVNLRLADNSKNKMNTGTPKNNKSGVKGVRWDSSRNKWIAQIRVNKKGYTLGRFDSLEEAVSIRKKAEIQHHGDFRRVDNDL